MPYIFLKLINMSITAGWMILAAVLLRLALKRAPKAFRYILWALVALRLILPVSFESVTSLIPDTEPVSEYDLIYTPYDTEVYPYTEFDPSVDPDDPVYLEMFVAEAPDESVMTSDEIIPLIWICGTAGMLIYCIASYAVLRHKVRASARLRDRIYICDGIGSPFILGIIRPRIYVPSVITEEQMSAVEAHERMHIRHGDHLWKLLGFLILSVYWWNPLIWLAYILFCRDIELICDETVVQKMEASERTAYSEALLSFNMPRKLVSACPLAFGEVGVKARIKSVLSYKKPTLWIIIASLIVCTVTAVCLLTDPVDKEESDPFKYDRIEVQLFGDGGEDEYVHFDDLKEGTSYTLPGYGDVDKIVCTVESVNPEKKTVTLKLDHALSRTNGDGQTDTVTLLLDHLAYDGVGYDNVTLEAPDSSGLMYCFRHVMIKDGGEAVPETDEPEKRPIDEYIELGKLPEEGAYAASSVEATVFGLIRPYNGMLYCNEDGNNALKFYEALDVGAFVPVELEAAPELGSFSVVFRNERGSLGDYTVYEDDTVVYGASRGEENTIYFKASDGTYERLVAIEEELNQSGTVRDISAYDESELTVYVYGKLYSGRKSYSGTAGFYDALNTESFAKLELDAPPELEYFRVFFNSESTGGSLGDYTVYEDDTVEYYLKRADNDPVFFKAAEGTYEGLVALEEELNTPDKDEGTEPEWITNLRASTDQFLIDSYGNGAFDYARIGFSENYNCYTLYVTHAASSSGLPVPVYVLSDLKNFTLSADNTDVYAPKLVVEHDGKTEYYTVGKGLTLTNDDGHDDLVLFFRDNATGFVNDTDDLKDTVTLSPSTISGAFAVRLTVKDSATGTHEVTYVPKTLYSMHLETDDNGFVKLGAKKGDTVYTVTPVTDGGRLILEGAPEDFGEAYVYPELTVPEDTVDKEYVNIDRVGSSPTDTVYLTEGPLFDRYSFTIGVKGDKYGFSSTYAYDTYCELDLVKDDEKIIQLKMTQSDGSVSLYDIKCEYVGFKVVLTCVEGKDILDEIFLVEEDEQYNITDLYSSETADVDGDGYPETVSVGPGTYSGLRSFSITIQDDDEVIGPVSFVSDSISQTLVKGDDGKLRLRAEYDDEVIFYDILPKSGGILADKNGIGVK